MGLGFVVVVTSLMQAFLAVDLSGGISIFYIYACFLMNTPELDFNLFYLRVV